MGLGCRYQNKLVRRDTNEFNYKPNDYANNRCSNNNWPGNPLFFKPPLTHWVAVRCRNARKDWSVNCGINTTVGFVALLLLFIRHIFSIPKTPPF